ncbi:benzoate/H(+) symporter BenE family transporter [Ideonella dechloratans]|uniref:Benzoate/H(+) symporter BenE family transporter n=1 Tax=Ideonella dechloratans TaxID=36863 RepID=A0A643FBJ4_IDEDE|nr:benzoate/H(+) symporter BenE family transporter [Ideonella dechloratans]KAB0582469.1 benzoate/H(+) symporter BenE family transporter [Ideonella dechloratans]UFU10512.1 benzoate/H(+) symporter BenE family transporter [Ideonella dechloratans]
MPSFWKDVSLSAVVAGFVAVLVGFTSSIAIIFAAAQAVGADTAQTASWIWALGLGTGLTSLGLSLWTRQPVLTAWSTPGAALIAASQGIALPDAVGAFLVCAGLILLVSVTGWFEKLMDRIPMAIAAALLAGVLTRFALDATLAAHTQPLLIVGMTVAFLAGRRWWPRYAVPGVLLAGIVLAAAQGLLHPGTVDGGLAHPVWVSPQFSLHAVVGLGLPLFVVTMASQNLPGVAAQRAAGYSIPVSPTVGATGLASLVLAPFGGFALNLAAITAAICMGREAHEQPERRYTASAAAGVFYIAVGLAGGAVAGLLGAFPKELVIGIAGLALLGTIGGGLASALQQERHRDAALLTYVVTLSGLSIAGIGSAFWGVLTGGLALLASQRRH